MKNHCKKLKTFFATMYSTLFISYTNCEYNDIDFKHTD